MAGQMRSGPRERRRWAQLVDLALLASVAISYPMYVLLDAVPRAAETGPPIADRYPWFLVCPNVVLLGARRTSILGLSGYAAILIASSCMAFTDEAALTAVAVRPIALSFAVLTALLVGHLAGRVLSWSRRRSKASSILRG